MTKLSVYAFTALAATLVAGSNLYAPAPVTDTPELAACDAEGHCAEGPTRSRKMMAAVTRAAPPVV